jgi:murein L,D-transpeptidase YcbB/YkuD
MPDDTPNYAAMSPPDDKHPKDYSYVERRAELYRLIEEAGHPHNLERSQSDLADRYGVSQRQISKDIQRLREFEAEHNTDRTKSVTSWLAEKAVMQAVQENDFERALELQMEYNDFLFELGELDREAQGIELQGDAGQAYMEMLRQAHENHEERWG